MNAERSTGRNAPCACGSGLKSKACCAKNAPPRPEPRTSTYFLVGLVVLASAAAYVVYRGWGSGESDAAEKAVPAALSTLPPVPIAPAPGATSSSFPGSPAQPTPGTLLPQAPIAQGPLTPQPPGPVPDGKVWSPEHGHWHDAAGSAPQITPVNVTPGSPVAAPSLTPAPQPPGPVPDGKVWSAEHGHWHDAVPTTGP